VLLLLLLLLLLPERRRHRRFQRQELEWRAEEGCTEEADHVEDDAHEITAQAERRRARALVCLEVRWSMSEGPGLGAGGGRGGAGVQDGHEEQQLGPWHCSDVVVERCRTRQYGHDSKGFEQNQKGTLEEAANAYLHSRGAF
jgi:hypothetical protein